MRDLNTDYKFIEKVLGTECADAIKNRYHIVRDLDINDSLVFDSLDSKKYKYIIMYAPTFREGAKDGKRTVFSEVWTIDFERLLENLEKKFGGDWYLCLRVHPQLAGAFKEYKNDRLNGKIIDESQADDMYEILAGMDAFVTDYSSAVFDASETDMPVFIYADDIEKYMNDRGSLLWELSDDTDKPVRNNPDVEPDIHAVLPFPVAKNNDKLEVRILNFDTKIYREKLNAFRLAEKLVLKTTGSKQIVRQVIKFMGEYHGNN